uniref:Uncharacterized protein n=1 Tax=uncultured Sphingobacteriia bacterium TaxID=246143 RepID=F4MM17_9BACT|nr:hypothetical protein S3_858_0009 [uncultured Sphingobacteriia bacterium]
MIFQSDEVKRTKKVNFVFFCFFWGKGDTIKLGIFLFLKNIIFRPTKKLFYQN